MQEWLSTSYYCTCVVLYWVGRQMCVMLPLLASCSIPSFFPLFSLSPTLHFSREQTSEQGRRGRGEERAEVWPQRATFCEYSASLIMMKTKPLEEYLIYSLSLSVCAGGEAIGWSHQAPPSPANTLSEQSWTPPACLCHPFQETWVFCSRPSGSYLYKYDREIKCYGLYFFE